MPSYSTKFPIDHQTPPFYPSYMYIYLEMATGGIPTSLVNNFSLTNELKWCLGSSDSDWSYWIEDMPNIDGLREITSHKTDLVYKMNFAASCKPSNISCLITCRRCGQWYVGEIRQLLHLRNNNHRLILRTGGLKNLLWQSTSKVMDTLANMTVVEIDQTHSHDPCLCKIWERR